MQKIPIAILGATGLVGQKLIELLISHPYFEIKILAASKKSLGKTLIEALSSPLSFDLPDEIAQMKISDCYFKEKVPIVFSALDSKVAAEIEMHFIHQGSIVISNAKNFRMQENVPLLIPEVNPEHLSLIERQKTLGKIITNPNCVVAGLALALKPLSDHFGLRKVLVTTMQGLSGAGTRGPSSYEMHSNIIPHIADEEEKVESEPKKILGIDCLISAQCNRVPIQNGHFMSVSVELEKQTSLSEILRAIESFNQEISRLPSSPEKALRYFSDPYFPQPRTCQNLDHGMSASIGKLRACPILGYKFNLLVNNMVRGAAGAAILNAELLVDRYPASISDVCKEPSIHCNI